MDLSLFFDFVLSGKLDDVVLGFDSVKGCKVKFDRQLTFDLFLSSSLPPAIY